jgi:hypothetical protein
MSRCLWRGQCAWGEPERVVGGAQCPGGRHAGDDGCDPLHEGGCAQVSIVCCVPRCILGASVLHYQTIGTLSDSSRTHCAYPKNAECLAHAGTAGGGLCSRRGDAALDAARERCPEEMSACEGADGCTAELSKQVHAPGARYGYGYGYGVWVRRMGWSVMAA